MKIKSELVITRDECNQLNEIGLTSKWNSEYNSCDVDFSEANLAGSDFENADLRLCTFKKANMTDSLFKDAKILSTQKNKVKWVDPDP